MSFNPHGGSSALSARAGAGSAAGGGASAAVLYDCNGRAAQLTRLGA